ANELLAQVQTFDEVVLHADRVQPRHHVFADAVVQDALAFELRLLLAVEGGGVVLEVLDEGARLRPLVEDLGLALVNLLAAGHGFKGLPARRRRKSTCTSPDSTAAM